MAFCVLGRTKVYSRLLNPLLTASNVQLPVFLCPALLGAKSILLSQPRRSTVAQLQQSRCAHTEAVRERASHQSAAPSDVSLLPLQCAGCGALSQTSEANEPGFFSLTRRMVKDFLARQKSNGKDRGENEVLSASLAQLDEGLIKTLNLEPDTKDSKPTPPPVCDRCHRLIHHQTGVSIHHPTIQSLQETIFETPHKYNHIYHVIDAADFPMSLIPNIHRLLNLSAQRSHNRRSKTGRFYQGKKTEVSFIITRSDLLAPLKSQVDHMMPYLLDTLRDALGSSGKDVRLGNVRCVSAKRSWWTRDLKEDVFKRGGGGWMVGKVNVGKSQLFESIFPKGRKGDIKAVTMRLVESSVASEPEEVLKLADEKVVTLEPRVESDQDDISLETEAFDTSDLLPPLPKEVDYPEMPLVSSLPGTTASPIRVPFGNGKGELVDLPGLSRGDLELHVQEQHRQTLVMKSRITPEQLVLKPGQSLLLGGFLRITPSTPDLVVLAYAFTPIQPHVTSTEKAIGIQTRERDSAVENIANEDISQTIKSAGKFQLQWDVTKKRTGPLTAKAAVNLKADMLPYRVMSADILIEGCGWVELVCQVRKRNLETPKSNFIPLSPMGAEGEDNLAPGDLEMSPPAPLGPEVEIFSPEGKFIGIRRPMGAWDLNHKKTPRDQKDRPRKSMKGDKKRKKVAARQTAMC